jgi:hypothetical protein
MKMPNVKVRFGNDLDKQNKGAWCSYGEEIEKLFIKKVAPKIKLDVKINPEKKTNKYAHDLIMDGNKRADLKLQSRPFFKSAKYGCDPNETVSFNKKDYERYKKLYPDIKVIFWVNWKKETAYGVDVNEKNGIWIFTLKDIERQIKKAPLHEYKNRVNDNKGNAKDSYLLHLKDSNRFA